MTRQTMFWACTLLGLTAAAAAPALGQAAPAAQSRHVLIVAHNKSLDPGVKPLRFADDDGARYYELFRGMGARVSLLTVMDPDTARTHPEAARVARVPWMRTLRQEVQRAAAAVRADNAAGRRTSFTFVYVGHGNVSKGGEGYINLQDMRLRRRDFFAAVVDPVPAATVHLVIDACKSFFLLSRGPGKWKDDRAGASYGEQVRAFLARNTLEARPHVGAFLSTSGDEEVHEWSAFQSGVFSHQLRSALSGAADINGDGQVEYSEAGAFIAAANYKVAHKRVRVRPFVRPPPANRRVALAELGRARDGVVLWLGAADQGHFIVEDHRGVRRVDLNKASGRQVRIALVPAAQRYFIRRGDREAVLAPGASRQVRFSSLPSGPVRSGARGSVDSAYHASLFAHPFSRSFYEGYLALSEMPAVSFTAPLPTPPALGLHLGLAYGISPAVLNEHGYGGVQHNLALGLRQDLGQRWFVSARAELGLFSGQEAQVSSSQMRFALLAGAGLRWAPLSRLELTLQLEGGYQALVLSETAAGASPQQTSSPAGGKLGSALGLALRPWSNLPRLALQLRAGLYGHLTEVRGATRTFLLPEGSLGLAYGF